MNKLWKEQMRIMQEGILEKLSWEQKEFAHRLMLQQLNHAAGSPRSEKREP
jgi:hypothetical protein